MKTVTMNIWLVRLLMVAMIVAITSILTDRAVILRLQAQVADLEQRIGHLTVEGRK